MPAAAFANLCSRAALAAVLASALPAAAIDLEPDSGLRAEVFVGGLDQVTDFAFLPDGTLAIAEKGGALKLRAPSGKVTVAAVFPVDDRSEKGLLGVIADPGYLRNRRLILYYSRKNGEGGTNLDRHRVVSVEVKPDGTVDPAREKILLRGLRGPRNHDGGSLAIGPDGKLYVGVGDTGCNSNRPPEPLEEPSNYFATCLSNANGKILRIELDGSIPRDNPLLRAGPVTACGDDCHEAIARGRLGKARTEIWAWGLRNPWRFWFDPRTRKLWVADVGEITYEEIDLVEKGRHYGWPFREGRHGFPVARCRDVVPDAGDCVEPIYECKHGVEQGGIDGDCQSITGGFILDACQWPAPLRGHYLFGDNARPQLWTLAVNPARDGVVAGSRKRLATFSDGIPVTIKPGPDGAAYVAVFPGDEGKIVRLSPAQPAACP